MNKFFRFSDLDDNRKVDASIDKFVTSSIENVIEASQEIHSFRVQDLDRPVNPDETLREYLNDSMREFGLPFVELDKITDAELNTLISKCDECWLCAV